jgi:hypothetical protein
MSCHFFILNVMLSPKASFCRRGLECFSEYNPKWIGWKHLLHPIPFLPRQSSSQENARGEECSDFTLTRRVSWGLLGASPHNTGLQNSLNVFSSVFDWAGIIHCKPRQNTSAKQDLSNFHYSKSQACLCQCGAWGFDVFGTGWNHVPWKSSTHSVIWPHKPLHA